MSITPIEQLYLKRENKQNYRIKVYKKVLEKCCNVINYNNDTLNNTCCVFEVPEMIFGLPKYNLSACIAFIMIKLREEKYIVEYYPPKHIYISWARPDIIKKVKKKIEQKKKEQIEEEKYPVDKKTLEFASFSALGRLSSTAKKISNKK